MATPTLPANPLSPHTTFPFRDTLLSTPQRAGIVVLMLYLFVMLSRTPEILAIYFGSSYSVVLVMTIVCLVFTILSGSFSPLASSRLTLYIVLLHAWYCVTVPFSTWRFGSVLQLRVIGQYVPMFFFIALFIRNEKHLRLAFGTVCAAMLAVLVYTMTFVTVKHEGYARVASTTGRFGNSNDLALFLLIGVPFWIFVCISRRFHFVIRLLAGLEIALSVFHCLRTGSRGALITMVLMVAVLFLISSMANKAKIAFVVVALLFFAVPLIPESVRDRLGSLSGTVIDTSAAASSSARYDLLIQSFGITASHPVFGVGLGVYVDAVTKMSAAAGERVRGQQVPHNTFTTVSAETGIPGMLFYIACLAGAGGAAWRARQIALATPGLSDFALMSGCVLLSFGVFLLNNLFFSMTGDLLFYLICGLCMACLSVAQTHQRAFDAANAQSRTPQATLPGSPVPVHPFTPRPSVTGGSSQYGNVPWARSPRRRP